MPQVPDLLENPEYRDVSNNLTRLRAEHDALEAKLADVRALRAEAFGVREMAAKAIKENRVPDFAVKSTLDAHRDDLVNRQRATARAIELATVELRSVQARVRTAVMQPFAEKTYLPEVRKTLAAFIAYAKAAEALAEIEYQLDIRSLFGIAGCSSPLPGCPWGRPSDPNSYLNVILGEVVARGIVRCDDPLLAGCHAVVPREEKPVVAAAAPAKKPVARLLGKLPIGARID